MTRPDPGAPAALPLDPDLDLGFEVDPELAAVYADLAEIAQERDTYAAEAAALRQQLADANTREVFLHRTIAQLQGQLAHPAPALAA
jgi:hypothetical protein